MKRHIELNLELKVAFINFVCVQCKRQSRYVAFSHDFLVAIPQIQNEQ